MIQQSFGEKQLLWAGLLGVYTEITQLLRGKDRILTQAAWLKSGTQALKYF